MVKNLHLLSSGNAALAERRDDFAALVDKLENLAAMSDARAASRARSLLARLQQFSAKIILVGQVKAGKSSLTNVLAGSPGLLPADVNPWTSVVTSIHIRNQQPQPETEGETKARFTFLDQNDWDMLVQSGGRLGELANRAGASDEVKDIERQIRDMRAKTERRLGKHFEMLLGQSHDYGYVDTELMERYVSLGDDYDAEGINAKTGCFADITKSAELFLDIPHYAMPMQLCDTPGVNDTFMMREQITIRSLRGAELCVVVLAAHQALTSVDLALMRIIATLEKRQIVLFVNRVDELTDPARQIPEIRNSIRGTLDSHRVASDVPIVFGSALWAEAALTGDMGAMPDDSIEVLETLLSTAPELQGQSLDEIVWHFSGLPELLTTLGERISQGSALHTYEKIRRRAHNLASETRAVMTAHQNGGSALRLVGDNGEDPLSMIKDIAIGRGKELGALCDQLHNDLLARMERAQEDFVKRATASLLSHFEHYGEQGTWTYEPAGLRVLHRSAYASFARHFRSRAGQLVGTTAEEVETLYRRALAGQLDDIRIEPPALPQVPPPVSLGKTLALDLQGSWWRRWWQQRRGFESSANEYADLIRTEIQTIIVDVIQSQVPEVLEECRAAYNEFMHEHLEMVEKLMQAPTEAPAATAGAFATTAQAADACAELVRDLEKMSA